MLIKNITSRINELRCVLECEEEQELKDYKVVYDYMIERAAEKSAQNNSEGTEELEKLIRYGLDEDIEYLETYEPLIHKAYNNLGNHFKEYCEFRMIKEEIEFFEECGIE